MGIGEQKLLLKRSLKDKNQDNGQGPKPRSVIRTDLKEITVFNQGR